MFKIIIGIVAAVLLLGAIAIHPSSPTAEANSPPAAVKGDRLDIDSSAQPARKSAARRARRLGSPPCNELKPAKTSRVVFQKGTAMADRKSLRSIGFLLGGIAVAVVLLAGMVMQAHVDGRLSLEAARGQIAADAGPMPAH